MSKILIESNPLLKKPKIIDHNNWLNISELFSDTIQGEGISTGSPATFMRLQNCSLNCVWCDTTSVWKHGNPYSFDEIIELFKSSDMIEKFKCGQHLILTGGSPLLQQDRLFEFLRHLQGEYGFLPYTEVENECMIKPSQTMMDNIDQWNNSPKLENSGMKKKLRYKPEIISFMSQLNNSTFKFVINNVEDWNEVQKDFLAPGLIGQHQVILMPCGENREQLSRTRDFVAELACQHNVRYSDRLHIVIWDKKTGV